MPDIDNIQVLIDEIRGGANFEILHEGGNHKTVYLPGFGSHPSRTVEINLDVGEEKPFRKRGNIVVFDAASFNQVLADNSDAGDIAIYIDRSPTRPQVIAVLNGHGPTGPGWGDFRATIQFRPTPQWTKWKEHDGRMMSQVAFAEFVEDNLEDIAEPVGAVMLEIATYLEAVRTVNFKSGIRLSNGNVQFRHEASDEAKVGASSLEVPEAFTLGIAPIFGLASYKVPARFRYRIQDGKLQLGYKLQRVESMMGAIIEDVVGKIERGTNISVLDGLPPG
jgi:uncharacterized protein YfdQ (DUF2303 family)